ncbi:MAG: hypothetical protein ACE5EN_07635 [Nitrospinota bacterium]
MAKKRYWYFKSKVGTFIIKPHGNNSYGLWINDDLLGNYPSPVAAADDVYVQVTGCYEWDSLKDGDSSAPTDIYEWEQSG